MNNLISKVNNVNIGGKIEWTRTLKTYEGGLYLNRRSSYIHVSLYYPFIHGAMCLCIIQSDVTD